MTSTNRVIVTALAIAALAAAFWMLLLGPKRDEAKKLTTEVETVRSTLTQHQAEVEAAVEARHEFAADYRRLVVLGKAVPGDDDTSSLLVQLNGIAEDAGVTFRTLELGSAEGTTAAAPAPAPAAPSTEGSATASLPSPTEVAASTLPLGAGIGPAGLGVMPYTLTFDGDFFQIADFIKGLDSMVKTQNAQVSVDGRLITINGFSLAPNSSVGFPSLEATFSVTTYLTPPTEGVTAGATPASPSTAALASSPTEGAP